MIYSINWLILQYVDIKLIEFDFSSFIIDQLTVYSLI